MAELKKPVITLKNIKHSAFASQETHCYSATIYVNGKKWGTVENAGHGGSDNVYPFEGGWKAEKALNELIAKTYPKWGSEYNPKEGDTCDTDLEIICGNLVNDFLLKKAFKRQMKRITYVEPKEEGLYQMSTKYTPTPKMIAVLREKAPWAKNVIFLNELPEDEAFELFKKHN